MFAFKPTRVLPRVFLFVSVLALVVYATPFGALAEDPKGFVVTSSYRFPTGWAQGRVQAHQYAVLKDGTDYHFYRISSAPNVRDIDAYAAAAIQKWRGDNEAHDDGTVEVCEGLHSHRWSFLAPFNGVIALQHFSFVSVYGGVGVAWYAHTKTVADRRDGLDTMNLLCPGPIPVDVPTGWTRATGASLATDLLATSADGNSKIFNANATLAPDRIEAYYKARPIKGNVMTDRTEPCGTDTMRIVESVDEAHAYETTMTYVHKTVYRTTYERPVGSAVDPAAHAAIIGTCTAGWPNPKLEQPKPDFTPPPTFDGLM